MRERQRAKRRKYRNCPTPAPLIPAHYVELFDYKNQRSVWVDPAELLRRTNRVFGLRKDLAYSSSFDRADLCKSFLGHVGWDCEFCGYHTRRLPAFLREAERIHWDIGKRECVLI